MADQITIDRAVVEQALEALMNSRPVAFEEDAVKLVRAHQEAIAALRAALAEPQEPLPWMRVIDEAMVVHHCGVADPADDYETAKRKLNILLCCTQDIGAYFAKQAEPVQEPDYWQEEARRYAGNADYWRKRYEALAEPVQEQQCNPHPKAPHGFLRNASHNEDRYVCECEGWDPYEAGYQAGMEAALAKPVQEPDYSICPTCGGLASDPIVPEALRAIRARNTL